MNETYQQVQPQTEDAMDRQPTLPIMKKSIMQRAHNKQSTGVSANPTLPESERESFRNTSIA